MSHNSGWVPNYTYGYEVKGNQFRRMHDFPADQNGKSKREIRKREKLKAAKERRGIEQRAKRRIEL